MIAVLLQVLENLLLGVALENAKGFSRSFACHKDFNRNLNYVKANDVEKRSFLMNMEKMIPANYEYNFKHVSCALGYYYILYVFPPLQQLRTIFMVRTLCFVGNWSFYKPEMQFK